MGERTSGRFVVWRRNWRRFERGWRLAPGRVPLAKFDTLEEASGDADRREAAVRQVVNPLACGVSLHDQTDFPEPVFLAGAGGQQDRPPETAPRALPCIAASTATASVVPARRVFIYPAPTSGSVPPPDGIVSTSRQYAGMPSHAVW
jgi:hypothetical protein